MKLTVQKRLAAKALKTSPKKVKLDTSQLTIIKESITMADIRSLIGSGVIIKKPTSQISRGRARKTLEQKRKGRRSGLGRRRGTRFSRLPRKEEWKNKIRAQREFLKTLKEKGHIDNKAYRHLYDKAHGGYFRNVRHIKLYIDERDLTIKKSE